MGCYNLASITFPEEGLTTISHDSFKACTSLCSVIIPEGVTTIDVRAFDDCTSLSSIVIPSSVKEIGHQAFQGCESLTDVVIPEGVIKIYWNDFLLWQIEHTFAPSTILKWHSELISNKYNNFFFFGFYYQ